MSKNVKHFFNSDFDLTTLATGILKGKAVSLISHPLVQRRWIFSITNILVLQEAVLLIPLHIARGTLFSESRILMLSPGNADQLH
jgi:hypothetical protein